MGAVVAVGSLAALGVVLFHKQLAGALGGGPIGLPGIGQGPAPLPATYSPTGAYRWCYPAPQPGVLYSQLCGAPPAGCGGPPPVWTNAASC